MKKIEALKNNKTGELDLGTIGKDIEKGGKYWFINGRLLYVDGDPDLYSKTTCLLIEESELKEKLNALDHEINELAAGRRYRGAMAKKIIKQLLNSLTK